MTTCGQILRWRPRYDIVHGDRHDHTCRLEAGHPVNDDSGVQVHTCSPCTLDWESNPRPSRGCRCSVETNPTCPIHGKVASPFVNYARTRFARFVEHGPGRDGWQYEPPHDGISRDEARRHGHPTRFVRPGT